MDITYHSAVSAHGLVRCLITSLLWLLSAAAVNAAPANQPANLNAVVVQSNDDYATGWNEGRLVVERDSDPRDTIEIVFRARKREGLVALSVSTQYWSVDLSNAVRHLAHPYVSRIVPIPREWSAARQVLFVHLPFKQDSKCRLLDIEIVSGSITTQETSVTDESRCEY